MTKYFDLLRAHQLNKEPSAIGDSIEVHEKKNISSQHNPYAPHNEDETSIILELEDPLKAIDSIEVYEKKNISSQHNPYAPHKENETSIILEPEEPLKAIDSIEVSETSDATSQYNPYAPDKQCEESSTLLELDAKAFPTTDDVVVVEEEATDSASQHNPYATQKTGEHTSLQEPECATDLIDEVSLQDDHSNHEHEDQALRIDDLPTEETTTQSATQTQENNRTSTSGFPVSAWLQEVSLLLQTIFQAAEKNESSDLSSLGSPLQNLLEQLEDNTKVLDALELEISRNIKQICNADCGVNDLVEKSIMMMLYTLKISLRLRLEHTAIVQHAVAAMLHHIGMAMVPNEVRQKVGKLTKDELALIRKAPENAVAYLKSCQITHENVLLAAEQAAERYDGSGPQGLSGHGIAWIARVAGLLSMFEALIHIRPY
ncbi:MAG: HD domain-containing phosphohydrolase, partial [Ghiorsea sp.]|nr:HD domain-containing phosphohydrolase [Ghiorsea sp.]